jgi:VanZ family protein
VTHSFSDDRPPEREGVTDRTRSVSADRSPEKDGVASYWRWAVVAAYMAAIFGASSGPGPSLPPAHNLDKVLHAGTFGVLSALAAWALTPGRMRSATWQVLLGAWLISTAYGALDETHQYFVPGRQADVFDLAADALGALAAAFAIRAWGIIARGSE